MTDVSVADLLGNLNQETTQGAVKTAAQSIDGKTPALVSGRVPVDGSGVTQPVSGTVTATQSGTWAQNLTKVNGASLSLGQKTAAGSLPVVLSSDGPFAVNFGLTTDSAVTDPSATASHMSLQKGQITKLASIDSGIGGASAAAAGDTGASTTNGFLRWMRDFWLSLKGTKTAANSISVTGSSDGVFYVGGVSPDGVAPTNQAVRVSGVDGSGLKRTLLTDTSGRQFVVMPDSTQTDMTFNSTSDIYTFDMTNYQSWSIQVTTPGSSNSMVWEFQDDGASSSWIPGIAQAYTSNGAILLTTGANVSTYAAISGQRRGRYMRVRISSYNSGPIVAKFTQMSSGLPGIAGAAVTGFSAEGNSTLPNPVVFGLEARTSSKASLGSGTVGRAIGTVDGRPVFRPHAIPENEWTYAAAASGIVNTNTAITIKAQAGANVRNYVTSVQIMSEALTNATELAIRDGANGTVLWRTKIGTSGLPHTNIIFNNPLKGTANTLLEVVTLTASGAGAVYFNAQGYIGP